MSNRIVWIDNVRMLAMVFVMLGHTWRLIDCPLPTWLGTFILAFNMPLFVILSGYVSNHGMEKINSIRGLGDYIINCAERILVPAVFMQSVSAIITILLQLRPYSHSAILHVTLILAFVLVTIYYHHFLKYIALLSIFVDTYANMFWFLSMLFWVMVTAACCFYICSMLYIRKRNILFPFLCFMTSLLISFIFDKTSDFIIYYLAGYYLYHFKVLDSPLMLKKYSSPVILVCSLLILLWGGNL